MGSWKDVLNVVRNSDALGIAYCIKCKKVVRREKVSLGFGGSSLDPCKCEEKPCIRSRGFGGE